VNTFFIKLRGVIEREYLKLSNITLLLLAARIPPASIRVEVYYITTTTYSAIALQCKKDINKEEEEY
jgi:hypothetical protein